MSASPATAVQFGFDAFGPSRVEALSVAARDASVISRFFAKSIPEPNTGCWLWTEACSVGGYGKFQITNHGNGPKQFHVGAHRFALAIKLERWPSAQALHGCDQPCCVNPSHLREGTQKENIADMDTRGRRRFGPLSAYLRGDAHPLRVNPERCARGDRNGTRTMPESRPRGERHPQAILNEAAVIAIRAAKGSVLAGDLAADYGIKRSTVYAIWSRRLWRHL